MSRGAIGITSVAVLCLCVAACSSADDDTDNAPPVAAPSVGVAERAAIGRVTEVTYRFEISATAPAFANDYTVFVHAVDERGTRVWTADHQPPEPTSRWRPNTVVEYTRPMRIPRSIKDGRVTLQLGLYLPETGDRLPLSGEPAGRRSYRVAAFDVHAPPSGEEDVFFADGWHGLEMSQDAQGLEWRWSRRDATVLLRNPKRDGVAVIELDQPVPLATGPQHVEIRVGAELVDMFEVPPSQLLLRRIRVPADTLGTAEFAQLTLRVDRAFVPAQLGQSSSDRRELGVRVFSVQIVPDADEPREGGGNEPGPDTPPS